MIRDSNLKITALISLGIHILIIAVVSGTFRDPKIHRTIALHHVKVALLPLVTKEKPDTKMIPPVPLKVQTQNGEEAVFDHQELTRETPLPSKEIAKNILPDEPGPLPQQREEERVLEEPVNVSMNGGGSSDANPNLSKEGDRVSPREATSMGGNLSISLPSFHSAEPGGSTFSYGGSGDGQGTGTGPGNGGPGNGGSGNRGSGRGKGIFGKFFSGHRGGNDGRPSYAGNPKPIYPQEAKEKGYEGEVVLRVEVLSNGRVGQVEVRTSSGYESLDRSALTTVKQWRFIPAKKGDVAIPLWVNIPIKFQLQ